MELEAAVWPLLWKGHCDDMWLPTRAIPALSFVTATLKQVGTIQSLFVLSWWALLRPPTL